MPSPEIDHSQAKLKPPASEEASCKPTFGTCVLNHASDETSFQLVWDMSDSNEIIRKQVFGLLRAGHTIDIYGLSETLREHCPDLSLDELVRKVGETVADRGGSAMWHKPGQSG